MEWQKDGFLLTDDRARIDRRRTGELLRESYWAAGREQTVVERCIESSLNFAIFHGTDQIGYSRVVTDCATYGYLCDVIVDQEHRGQGLGTWMVQCILGHPELENCRIDLVTKDAQGFYRPLGFGRHRFEFMVRYPEDYAGGSGSASEMES